MLAILKGTVMLYHALFSIAVIVAAAVCVGALAYFAERLFAR